MNDGGVGRRLTLIRGMVACDYSFAAVSVLSVSYLSRSESRLSDT